MREGPDAFILHYLPGAKYNALHKAGAQYLNNICIEEEIKLSDYLAIKDNENYTVLRTMGKAILREETHNFKSFN